jgi:hypothetical protein
MESKSRSNEIEFVIHVKHLWWDELLMAPYANLSACTATVTWSFELDIWETVAYTPVSSLNECHEL